MSQAQYRSAAFATVLPKPYRYWQLTSAIDQLASERADALLATKRFSDICPMIQGTVVYSQAGTRWGERNGT